MRSWKTKAVLPSIQGKGQQGDINQNVSPCIGYVSPVFALGPPAWNYWNLVGSIYQEKLGQYSKPIEGSVFFPDPSEQDALGASNGGYYFNR